MPFLIETDSYGIYWIDGSTGDYTVIKKTTDEGTTVTTVYTLTGSDGILSMYYDRDNDKIYFMEGPGNDGGGTYGVKTHSLDLANSDNPTEEGRLTEHIYGDIFKCGSDFLVLTFYRTFNPFPVEEAYIRIYDITLTTLHTSQYSYGTWSVSQTFSVNYSSDIIYYLYDHGGDIHVWKYIHTTTTASEVVSCGSNVDLPGSYDDLSQRGLYFNNNDSIYFQLKDTADSNVIKLFRFDITPNTVTKGTVYNVYIELDRFVDNSNSLGFNLEKAYENTSGGQTGRKVYQISANRNYLNYISFFGNIRTDGNIVGITDTYLIYKRADNTIELFIYQDFTSYITGFANPTHSIFFGSNPSPSFDIYVLKTLAQMLERGVFIEIGDNYFHNGSQTSGSSVLGCFVLVHDTKTIPNQKFTLVNSLFYELNRIYPNITDYTDYTGKTSGEVITQLLLDFCQAMAPGSITNGSTTWTCPADWKANGDKNLLTIIHDFEEAEGFTARIRPTGELDFNDGTTASGLSIASTDEYENVITRPVAEVINYVKIWGGFVDGTQIGPVTAENKESQQKYGIKRWERTYAGILDATILQTIATAKLALLSEAPLIIEIELDAITVGFVQPGETVSVGANIKIDDSDATLTAGTYIVVECRFNPRDEFSGDAYTKLILSDGLYFEENPLTNLPQQNSQLIQQIAGTVATINSNDVLDYGVLDEDNMTSDSDTDLATQQSIKAYVDTEIVGISSRVMIERLRLWRGLTGADLDPVGIKMNLSGEDVMMHFYCNPHVDTSQDIVITCLFRVDNSDTSISMLKSAGIIASSEAWSYTSYWNGVAWTLTSAGQNKPCTFDFTIPAAAIETGDLISLQLDLNEGSRIVYCILAYATYVYKE